MVPLPLMPEPQLLFSGHISPIDKIRETETWDGPQDLQISLL